MGRPIFRSIEDVEGYFIGNQPALAGLRRAMATGRFPHAVLFHGPEALGKCGAALLFFQELFGTVNADALASHPDVLIIAPAEDEGILSIAQAREIRRFLSSTPLIGTRKAVLIDGGEYFTVEAVNALLKVLEEPPPHAIIMIVAHDLSRVLPTIRSRTVPARFQLVADDELAEGLLRLGFSETRILKVLPFADGRPGLAVRMLRDDQAFLTYKRLRDGAHRVVFSDLLEKYAFLARLERENEPALRSLPSTLLAALQKDLVRFDLEFARRRFIASFIRRCFVAQRLLQTTNAKPSLVLTHLFVSA